MKIVLQDHDAFTSTPADDYVFEFMMGYISQGHGCVRVRGIIPFIKYLRIQYGWDLRRAAEVGKAWDAAKAYEVAANKVASGRDFCVRGL